MAVLLCYLPVLIWLSLSLRAVPWSPAIPIAAAASPKLSQFTSPPAQETSLALCQGSVDVVFRMFGQRMSLSPPRGRSQEHLWGT